ncbi:periplasmic [Fe] hydrogenase large subunit [Clostridium homopropionicum DSM 5847]|uniref:Periplasmic [Fe] hydrogenase large subunit n=1 Tax=Clostridium homopropionicum DSM 5847 TaxID=1121318 RepID=A0A0L6ZAI8_9CLOT|nr:[Fe-Fe] hydrogenase large subunit C-terminal domain-containing protein [Clostridium homopropionicum]KOA19991.1 periplasmic [Fe] hydrogenase large subunit [Clostridium homopropionicum DSM 5847]SFG64129.1 Iron only hydrogenase large subunit, C-terminal domain [Clostridium homopropionicum]
MAVINFSKANCMNCYKCVRECPVKAIKVKDEQAQIVEELCIACGNCLRICPQNAKEIQSELVTVKTYINKEYKVVASVAPAFIGAFKFDHAGQFVSALKRLGFSHVEQTAVGAALVSKEYSEFYNNPCEDNYITTSCPGVNYLIQKYYPSLIASMIPVISPMVCHGKTIKERYGEEAKVVFLGPCLAKKLEAIEDNSIDAVLTFDELNKWFQKERIVLNELPIESFDAEDLAASIYPIAGGISATLDKKIDKKIFKVDGIDNCVQVLGSLEKNEVKSTWIEMNLCNNSCINGPAMPEEAENLYLRKYKIEKYVHNCEKNNKSWQQKEVSINNAYLKKEFINLSSSFAIPNEEEIRGLLKDIGKIREKDELNCGACGYNTCREKAIAVYNGMAEKNMCLPYMRQRAEMLTNVIFDVTPNAIFILNDDLDIINFNPSAETLFNVARDFALKKPVTILMEDDDFIDVRDTKRSILSKKVKLKHYNLTVLETAVYIEEHKAILVIMIDITNNEKKEKKLEELKLNTLDMAQEVIDKQMRVAQEIASLLGETTAETKVILTKLKKIVQSKEDDI